MPPKLNKCDGGVQMVYREKNDGRILGYEASHGVRGCGALHVLNFPVGNEQSGMH